MAMGFKKKVLHFLIYKKIFLILHVLSDCPSLLNEKREKKKNEGECHFKAQDL